MSCQKCTLKAKAVQTLLTEIVEEANERCQFSQRNRQCDAQTFVQMLVLGWLENPEASLEELTMVGAQLGCRISAQGLDYRINERAVMFLAYVLAASMQHLKQSQRLPAAVLEQFTGVYLTDSTQFKLPNKLYEEFRGNGTSQAMGKWQVTLEYLTGKLVALQWKEGRSPDQQCLLPVSCAEAGSLQLFDLGYFKQDWLAKIDQQQAYFVSRYQSQTALYEPATGEKRDLASDLKQTTADIVELPCVLGRKKLLTVRLVARRLSEKAAAERRRKANKKAQAQKKSCSKTYLILLGWEIMVTNLSTEDYPPMLIFALYGLRWQIELLFKTWKSQLKVAQIGNWRETRVFCQLYATLIACVLCLWWTSGYRWWQDRLLSVTRMIQSIRRHIPGILHCITRQWRGISTLFKKIEGDFSRHARIEKRKKSSSTLQILINWGLT